MRKITVFISYSHDSDEHRKQVLGLSERLRADGIETQLDQYVNGSPEERWPRWMLNQLDEAQFVIVVCTETYYRRFRGHEEPGKGKGVDWEGALITQEIYDSRSKTLKFVPVFLDAAEDAHIPEPLRGISYYALTSNDNYQNLCDFLLGRAGVEPGPVGSVKAKPREQGTPLTFEEPQASKAVKIDLSHFEVTKYAPDELIGREAEIKFLKNAWKQAVNDEAKRPHVLTFVALGGEGKTSLVAKWAAELAHENWPGCEAVFAWSFYSQGSSEQTAANSDLFLDAALEFFGDKTMANSAQHATEKAKRLAQLVGASRNLLILDGVEPLQYAPTSPMPGEFKDQGLATLLKALAASNHGLCLVITRYSIPDLKTYWENTAPEKKLLRLSTEAGVALLKSLGVNGNQQEYETLVEDVRGHALTLNLLGAYLRDAHAGDIRKRDLIKLEEADEEEQGGHAFRVMDAYAQTFEDEGEKGQRALALLRLLGLFDRPAPADCLQALWQGELIDGLNETLVGISEAQRNFSLTRLKSIGLLTVNRDNAGTLLSLDAHPLLREYFAKRLSEQQPEAWRAGHKRLYEYLCETTKEGEQPTLAELQPLYQAVVHGCLAGLQQKVCDEVYLDRILRGGEFYSKKKLGAIGSDLGAVACFYDALWNSVSPVLSQAAQAWLLNEAAYSLCALGRLSEALETMRAGLEMRVKQENWKSAAAVASNLSELELTMGELGAAMSHAEQSVSFAEKSDDKFLLLTSCVRHADTLFQTGQLEEAEVRFREAEAMQAKFQPDYPLLYTLQGFYYCDLLLSIPERGAWLALRGDTTPQNIEMVGKNVAALSHVQTRAVAERVEQTLDWWTNHFSNASFLDTALEHLTLSRTTLYTALLEKTPPSSACQKSIEQAVDGLRRAGQQQYLPLGLLTRALLSTQQNNPKAAVADLNEALEIAERGPMPLYLADIYLHRARLFFRESAYPWHNPDNTPRTAKQDLAEARRLIEKHGYWRRRQELEDAEAVIDR